MARVVAPRFILDDGLMQALRPERVVSPTEMIVGEAGDKPTRKKISFNGR